MVGKGDYKTLLYLLQVANSSFPTGAFNHSYGFETLIDEGTIYNAETLEVACRDWLLYGVAPADGAAAVSAHRANISGDLDQLIELDNLIGALKLAREVREASYKTGRAFLTAVCNIFHAAAMESYAQAIKRGRCEGHQSVAFGAAAATFGVTEDEATLVFLQSTLTNLLGVAARLIPLGQVEAQRIITKAAPLLTQAANVAKSRKPEEFGTMTAALDIAAMGHERLYSRLCMS